MAFAFAKALAREEASDQSACTISAPTERRASEAGDEGLRVKQRTCQFGSLRNSWATDEPWFPVAPTTAIIFLGDAMTRVTKVDV